MINAKKNKRLLRITMMSTYLFLNLLLSTSASAQYVSDFSFLAQTKVQIAEAVNMVKAQAEQLTFQKGQALAQERIQRELQAKANEISAGITNKLNATVQSTIGNALGGPVGQMLKTAGIDPSKIIGTPGSPIAGKTNVYEVEKDVKDLKSNTNPTDAIAAQTALMIKNQISDRMSVSSMLDEKPNGTCTSTSADKCTVLMILREQDARSLNALFKENISAARSEVEGQKGSWSTTVLKALQAKVGNSDAKLLQYLTIPPALPIGFEADAQSNQQLADARLLSFVLVGSKNDLQFAASSILDVNNKDNSLEQMNAISKIAKIQLARNAILNVNNEQTRASFNAQFRACVVRPDIRDTVGSTQEQHLVNIQSLLRCNNLILLQARQQEMESQRLQAITLLTLLDLYAVQEPRPVQVSN